MSMINLRSIFALYGKTKPGPFPDDTDPETTNHRSDTMKKKSPNQRLRIPKPRISMNF